MLTGKTESGFEFTIDTDRLQDDWEFIELAGEVDSKPEKLPQLTQMLLGDEGYQKLKKYCTKNGHVSGKMMMEEINQIYNTLNSRDEVKN